MPTGLELDELRAKQEIVKAITNLAQTVNKLDQTLTRLENIIEEQARRMEKEEMKRVAEQDYESLKESQKREREKWGKI